MDRTPPPQQTTWVRRVCYVVVSGVAGSVLFALLGWWSNTGSGGWKAVAGFIFGVLAASSVMTRTALLPIGRWTSVAATCLLFGALSGALGVFAFGCSGPTCAGSDEVSLISLFGVCLAFGSLWARRSGIAAVHTATSLWDLLPEIVRRFRSRLGAVKHRQLFFKRPYWQDLYVRTGLFGAVIGVAVGVLTSTGPVLLLAVGGWCVAGLLPAAFRGRP